MVNTAHDLGLDLDDFDLLLLLHQMDFEAHDGERDRSDERERHVKEDPRAAADVEPVPRVVVAVMTPLAVFHRLLLLES